jgi:hypothetical protein
MPKNPDIITISKSHLQQAGVALLTIGLITLYIWSFIADRNHDRAIKEEINNLKIELEECRAEATAWYNATTSLSDEIVFAALKGLPAEKVNTNIATQFAVKGHELKCIEPKLPTG